MAAWRFPRDPKTGAGEEAHEGDHTEADGGELPPFTEEGLAVGLRLGLFPEFALGLELISRTFTGSGGATRTVAGKSSALRLQLVVADGDEAEQGNGQDEFLHDGYAVV